MISVYLLLDFIPTRRRKRTASQAPKKTPGWRGEKMKLVGRDDARVLVVMKCKSLNVSVLMMM